MISKDPRPTRGKHTAHTINRAAIVDQNFLRLLQTWDELLAGRAALTEPIRSGSTLSGAAFLELFESQVLSRHLDFEARAMRARNEGFYTIGSAGHEGNAVLGRLTRHTDPAFLHYRSGAFMMERARKLPHIDPVYDAALSLAASAADPISGGRHKVWGSKPLWVLPQTSTIGSQLPKAVGMAIAIALARRSGTGLPIPPDAIIVCSFGDASVDHAATQAGFNAAAWTTHQHLPCPILLVCEDNGLGISLRPPAGWIEASLRGRPGIRYFTGDGLDLVAAHAVAAAAVEYVRRTRQPAFLHLHMQRLLGHAGSDLEDKYRSLAQIEAGEAQDPLLHSARTALRAGLLSVTQILDRYQMARQRVRKAASRAARTPKLEHRTQIMRPLAPYDAAAVNTEARRVDYQTEPQRAFGGSGGLPERQPPRHLAVQLNRALHELLVKYPQAIVFGEDVAQKGGVYTVTAGLYETFKGHRVFNTLIDETAVLGLAQGAAYLGLLPIPEIQYLAYFHNACDQIRGEAASLQFFSNGQYANPLLMRIAAFAYQKGFGGHFHNDNSIAALRDIPGLIIACPARGDDAVQMLRTCAALNTVNGRVVAFLEPIALYMTKDLYQPNDGKWLFPYPAPGRAIPLGSARVYHARAHELLIITYGNGVWLSLRAARRLRRESGARIRIVDLRWLKPLNRMLIARHARSIGRVLVVDEGRRTGALSEEIVTAIVETCGRSIQIRRVVGEDSYIPLGKAAQQVLPNEEQIIAAARSMLAATSDR
ncbi:transketolase C-terminal domain-containing protein [Nitrococcus mobilis]|uniref:3-methyl-2-oxobutanoate dehydrogenase (2-methylpropanoyl-transferring) n=1 Tax=Nitrococcus mobilis Nb-231 TaxID=314278 RepID=A4BPB0_9GAMM|nr:transketolase C-terminal domain-containing protein [Nitrococcus mobilis]EAR22411.1 2-oxoisovalerate dehydrogenase, E1 component, alpha and beta fusion [Nitrococcus mobilis Nb-231]